MFMIALVVTSCQEPTIIKQDKLPILVDKIKDEAKFDTVLTISDNNKVYLFETKQNEYIGEYYKETDDIGFGIFIGIVIGLFIVLLLFAAFYD